MVRNGYAQRAGLMFLIAFGIVFGLPEPAIDAADAVRFENVTPTSGIKFLHQSDPDKKYIVESMGGGLVLLDYDGDSWQDIYFVNSLTVDTGNNPQSARSELYRNNGDGTFTDVTDRAGIGHPGWGMGACAADYDGDGWVDVYVTCFGPNRLYRNNGDGTFSEKSEELGVADPRWGAGCGFADYDNDSDLDLFVSNYVDFRLDDLPEFGKGDLCNYKGVPVQCGPRGLPGAGDVLFRNEGGARFSDVSDAAGVSDPEGYYGLGVLWTDVDGDGWIDLFVANDARPNFMYHNLGNGTFEEMGFLAGTAVGEDGTEQGSMGIASGDLDRDGDLDLFVSNFSEEYNTIYRYDQDLTYTDVSFATRTAETSFPFVGWGTNFFDYDNDGWLDLMVVNGHVYPQVEGRGIGTQYAERKLFFRNNRDGTFRETAETLCTCLMERRVSRGLVTGDLDNDGDLDVVINDLDGAPMVLRNQGGNQGNWIRVKLQGKRPNTSAIGARVKVVSGNLVQISELYSGASYLSQHDLRQHFGLGDLEKVEYVEVSWPAGAGKTRVENVRINSELVVVQE